MSVAIAQAVIKYRVKSGTYTTYVNSPSGDLVQYYTGTKSSIKKIYVDFHNSPRSIFLVSISSRQTEGVATFSDNIKVNVNGIDMSFNQDGVNTTTFGTNAGQFKLVKSNNSLSYYDGIQIQKNLLVDSQFAPITITLSAPVQYGTQTDILKASYTIPVMEYSGNGNIVTIKAGDNNNFVITSKDTTSDASRVIMEAYVYDIESGAVIEDGLTYQWQKAVATNEGWENISDATAKTFKVKESDIATYGDYRVLVYENGSLIGSDTRSVMDATDPYVIELNPNHADETIDEDENGNSKVTYTPKVAERGSGKETDGFLFCFSVKDAGGAPLNKWQNGNGDELDAEMATTPQKSYEVTRAQCMQAQGNVNLTVFAVTKS